MKKIDSFGGEFAFLSNFYDSEITDGVRKYPTVEHYFQAMKTSNNKERDAIAHASTPGQAKRLGRTASLRKDWESVKVEIMRNALLKKFSIPELRAKLIATGNAELIEGNTWHDNTWGNCNCPSCMNITGQNLLGKLLMEIRESIPS